MPEGEVRVTAADLPHLDGDRAVRGLGRQHRDQRVPALGTFNSAEDSGAVHYENVLPDAIPNNHWNLLLLTVEDNANADHPSQRHSIAGVFPQCRQRAAARRCCRTRVATCRRSELPAAVSYQLSAPTCGGPIGSQCGTCGSHVNPGCCRRIRLATAHLTRASPSLTTDADLRADADDQRHLHHRRRAGDRHTPSGRGVQQHRQRAHAGLQAGPPARRSRQADRPDAAGRSTLRVDRSAASRSARRSASPSWTSRRDRSRRRAIRSTWRSPAPASSPSSAADGSTATPATAAFTPTSTVRCAPATARPCWTPTASRSSSRRRGRLGRRRWHRSGQRQRRRPAADGRLRRRSAI